MPTLTLDLNKNKNNTMTTPTVAAPVYTNTATTPAEDPYDKFTTYYNKVYNTLSQQAPTVEYNMTPEAKLRAGIQNSLLPAYRQAIANRQRQTNVERASIDADAAARGMGASTWVTDAKTRRADSEADDIATMQGNYMSTLASRLADAIYAEKANKLSADQFNANLKANTLSQALSTALSTYDKFGGGATSGGSAGGSAASALSGYTPSTGGNPSTEPNREPNNNGDPLDAYYTLLNEYPKYSTVSSTAKTPGAILDTDLAAGGAKLNSAALLNQLAKNGTIKKKSTGMGGWGINS